MTGSHFEWQSRNGKTHIDIQIGTGDSGSPGTVSVIVLVLAVAFFSASAARSSPAGESASRSGFLQHLTRSRTDCWIGGVCGGLGAHTPVPPWIWRLAFAILFFAYGTGLLAYIALWLFMPTPRTDSKEAAAPSDPNLVSS
jgi:phage shock protein PspC (stress-responsive transcriptional regulator)